MTGDKGASSSSSSSTPLASKPFDSGSFGLASGLDPSRLALNKKWQDLNLKGWKWNKTWKLYFIWLVLSCWLHKTKDPFVNFASDLGQVIQWFKTPWAVTTITVRKISKQLSLLIKFANTKNICQTPWRQLEPESQLIYFWGRFYFTTLFFITINASLKLALINSNRRGWTWVGFGFADSNRSRECLQVPTSVNFDNQLINLYSTKKCN